MSTSAVSAHRVSRGIRTIGRELAGPDVDETRGFSRRVRRMAVIYVVATLPIITLVGGLAQDRTSYILIFVLVGSAAYATPAMIVGWAAVQRAPAMERYRWMLWASGVTLMFIVGVSMLVGLVTGWRFANGLLGTGIVVVINVLFVMSLMALVRLRSGDRVLSVDIIESVMSIVVLSAPFVLLWVIVCN